MTEREKIIGGLEYCNKMKLDAKCAECPYNGDRKELPDCLDNCGILDDVIALVKSMEADADMVARCRDGEIKKIVGARGVIVMNFGWWLKIIEKDGFRIVPTPEQLGVGTDG